ncbi:MULTISPECIES: TfpX/TfpZ family type IV pilin accessory protein [unclassified Pseudomonas]|uniref:TfpX/TfpZ family type IV pilin accessory protein n=1 Tax=unclassified Pseudomonas TaxID=196821 RepID=UPI00244C0000|nr:MULTISPECIES: TfpX/TfpZ family type IV pilin accessory protein [unclassified Pseudomonas]MDG9931028.1 type IV pilin accessory protein [Pseudomonas sp. GD04042]MDH0485380.1 type IV pilin accessory protein [Pseudomonas sp. GD04015]MDH0605071.1 type IV pilin accessory protein [Pseudomonas sp. GD03869]
MPSRFKAFLIHLALSATIAGLSLLLVLGVWYPAPLHMATGVTGIFMILLAVDVTLGPVLTLIIYKAGKKSLLFDMLVIACLQLAALGYGLWSVADGRPAWFVFNVDRFDLVRVPDIDERKLLQADKIYRAPPWFGPRWVAAISPVDIVERNELVLESTRGGSDLPHRPNYYHPLSQVRDKIQARLKPLAELERFNTSEAVRQIKLAWPEADTWLPLKANVQPMVVLMRSDNAKVVAVVDLRPWN